MQSWPIVPTFLPRVVVFKLLLFSNSNNVSATLEVVPNIFKMQPCIFGVFRSLDLVFNLSILLQISGVHFLIFKECFSNFWTSFSLLTDLNNMLFTMLAIFFPIDGPVISTVLKLLAISLMSSSSSFCPDSELSLLIAKLTCAFLVVSTSRPICLSKSATI